MAQKRVYIIISFIFCLFISNAQQSNIKKYKVQGQILDQQKVAIDFVNVSLFKIEDSTVVSATYSNEAGMYTFELISDGTYYIQASHLLYEDFRSQPITLYQHQMVYDMETIILLPSAKLLDEVTVKSTKPFITRELGKIVVNVENSIVSAGSSLLEVLQRSPGVFVQHESSLQIKGKSGVAVYIDGKMSPLSGPDLIMYLRSIPSSQVQTIEIITNPSAKYDAAGNAGIIQIKFKKDQQQGMNGSATLSLGQGFYRKPSLATQFNYRNNPINLFGSYSLSTPVNFTRFYINRTFFDQQKKPLSTFDQTSFIKQPMTAQNVRFGLDYQWSRKTIVGCLFNINWNDNQRNGQTNSLISTADGKLEYKTHSLIQMQERRFNHFGNFNLKHEFDSLGTVLTVDIDYGTYDNEILQQIYNTNSNPIGQILQSEQLETDQKGQITVKSLKADYSQSLRKNLKMEAGLKSSLVTTDNDVKFLIQEGNNQILDTSRSNQFIYKENVNAAYISLAHQGSAFDISLGLRLEHTYTDGKQLATGDEFNRNFVSLFPNLTLTNRFSDAYQCSFLYSRRIDRPDYRQLNPFRIFVDPYTYVVGDPSLRPVFTDNFEINHTFLGQFQTAFSFVRSVATITDIFIQDDETKISYQIPANIQDFVQANVSVYLPFQWNKSMQTTFSGAAYWNRYKSPLLGANLNNEFTSWDVNVNHNCSFGNGWSAEVSGFYQAKNVWGLFIIKDLAQVSAGIQKLSADKRSSLKLSVSDLFLTNRIAVIVKYQNQDFFTNRTWDSQVLSLAYTFRFGKNTVPKARQRSSGIEDEKRRAS